MNDRPKITNELLIEWDVCSDCLIKFNDLIPDGEFLEKAIDVLVDAGFNEYGYWLFENCANRNLYAAFISAGYLNSGDCNVGHFNTKTPETINVFDMPCDRDERGNAYKPRFTLFSVTEWVNETEMTNQEKIDNPEFHLAEGYLKTLPDKDAFIASWKKSGPSDRIRKKFLPNSDAGKFCEISGIKV